MLLIREFAAPLASLLGIPGDLVGTADAWGEGFVDELNYDAEASNAERFNQVSLSLPLTLTLTLTSTITLTLTLTLTSHP